MVLDLNKMPAGEEIPAGFGGSHHGCHGVPIHGPWPTLTPAQLRVLYNMVEVPVNYHRIHHFVTHQPNGRAEHSWISWPPSQQATRRGTMIHPFQWTNLFYGIAPAPASRPPVAVAPADVHTSPFLSTMEGRRSSVRLEELSSSLDHSKIIERPITVDLVPTRHQSSMYRQNQHQQAEHIGSSSQQGAKNHVKIEDIRAPPLTLEQRHSTIQIEESVPATPKGNCNNRGLHRAMKRAQQQKWTAEYAAARLAARNAPAVPPALPPRHPCSTSQAGGGVHQSSPSLATVLSMYNQRRPAPSVPAATIPMWLVPVLASCSVPSLAGKKQPSPLDTMSAPTAGSSKFKLFNVEIDVAVENAQHASGRHCGHGIVNPPIVQNQSGGHIELVGNALTYAPPLVRDENQPPKLYKPTSRRRNTTDKWSPYRMFW